MDILEQYRQFADAVELCENEEALKQYQSSNANAVMQKEYWKQRQIVFNSQDPLEKQKARVKLQWLQRTLGCSIPLKKTVKRFTAPNGLSGIVISPETTLGADCVIFPQVYIGPETLEGAKNAGIPSVGNNVNIGPGAKILGNVVIGDNVRIDANCCVMTDVPANSHVVNCGSSIIRTETALNNQYISVQQMLERQFALCIYDYDEHVGDSDLTVGMAQPCDIDAIMQLYKDRVNWFRWKKQTQWSNYLINHPKEEFLLYIQKGEYYVLRKEQNIIGGFVLTADSDCWQDDSANALYLRRAVTKVGYKHLGNCIATEAKKLAAEAGKESLRLECVFSNEALNRLWENMGFVFVRDVECKYHFTLRELKID